MRWRVLTTALIITALSITPLYGHSRLTSSSPSADAVVELFPTEISLTFNEELLILGKKEVNTLSLTDGDGVALELEPAEIKGNSIARGVTAPPRKGGVFTIQYRVVSADGHPIEGRYTFTFTPSPSSESTTNKENHKENNKENTESTQASKDGEPLGTPPTLVVVITLAAIALLAFRRLSARR